MRGIVFTELMEFVEETWSPEMADEIIEASDLPSGGAYTAVARYDHHEMLALVSTLSARSGIPVARLECAFGQHLFGRLVRAFPHFLEGTGSALEFLAGVETYVHTEVRKLYPDAELPRFETHFAAPDRLVMTYRSSRPLADLAEGLIRGCAEHFREPVEIQREDLSEGNETVTRFLLSRGP